AQFGEPFGVVEQPGGVRAAEIEKALQLRANFRGVLADRVTVRQRPLRTLAARVTDQSGTASGERDRPMPVLLEPHEEHDDEQAPDMQAGRRGVEADVSRNRPAGQELGGAFGMLIQQTAPPQLIQERLRSHGTKLDNRGMNSYAIPIHETVSRALSAIHAW